MGQGLWTLGQAPLLFGWRGDEPVADGLFPRKLTVTAHGFRFFSGLFLRGFLVRSPTLHFPEDALALHLLLKNSKRLVDIVIAYNYLQRCCSIRVRHDRLTRPHKRRSLISRKMQLV